MGSFRRAALLDDLLERGLFGRGLDVGQQLRWISEGLSIVRGDEGLDGLVQRILSRSRTGDGALGNLESR